MTITIPSPIRVHSSSGNYSVLCQSGLLHHTSRHISSLGTFSNVQILSSPKVWRALGSNFFKNFSSKTTPHLHLFNDAESAKNLATVEKLSRSLVRAGADRHSLLIALGGGVVGDVVGFVAASYLRGVALVQIPTTVVAQVDSSVGGKTGVNLPEGKNLVGAFYPPQLVLVDPLALATLPAREFRGGLAEVIKYGVIADAQLFAYLESNMQRILRRDSYALLHIIRRSIEIKARVVSADEKESGLREILNFGHTFGHALESTTRYKKFQHGEAIAWGMMCAALLGHEMVGTPPDEVSRLVSLIRQIGPLPAWPANVSPQKLIAVMHSDKKARAGKLRFVLSKKIGTSSTYDSASEQTVSIILRVAPNALLNPLHALGKSKGHPKNSVPSHKRKLSRRPAR